MQTHNPSSRPRELIETLTRRPEQPSTMRMYRDGYSKWLDAIPTLKPNDPLLGLKTKIAGTVVSELARTLREDNNQWWQSINPPVGDFMRTILAIEEPEIEVVNDEELATLFINHVPGIKMPTRIKHEGAELLVGHWGAGFSSPVHGHAPGLLHEEILAGTVVVNTYNIVSPTIVRPLRSDIVGVGTLVSTYNPPSPLGARAGLVHNFITPSPATTLHYVAEHTRDGRDNGYEVEQYYINDFDVLEQLNPADAMHKLRVGDVVLVRSVNVPEFGDHFIVITGAPVLKPHGLRPQDIAIVTTRESNKLLLDNFVPMHGITLLKLDKPTADNFRSFHQLA